MKLNKKDLLLYAVTDRHWVGKQTLFEQVEEAIQNGATLIQLREKHLDEANFLKEAIAMRELCHRYGVPFIVNDNVEVALRSHADGVHVGQDDMAARDVRRLIGDEMILGVSAHNVQEAKAAQDNGADYLGVGAIFTTATKKDATAVSLSALKEIVANVDIPVVAIGGINENNILQLKNTRVAGVSIISAIFGAEDIGSASKNLLKLAKEVVK
ncbi:thiamine-phosphate pyrophosphorylase [Lactobacillus colini]|uniref:Thiamine-phosphate synthase n=1 Tax=Lactobacillus colini TaxID=1819254 RepID=A0ABS4MHD0_9LACO|nr:thiamine phosphate synthase [Lactobacillus colini]MBP2058759.1 thiamine-phosphate pyrophosphorylase [Lactobacillus colini]